MSQILIGLVGLSGVGKTTALRRLAQRRPFQHLSAGELISKARQVASNQRDSLRTADINENQQLLVRGFSYEVDHTAAAVVLDAHTLIETPKGLEIVAPDVFRSLRLQAIVFLADTPDAIWERRRQDTSRKRPLPTIGELASIQGLALAAALEACLHSGATLRVVKVGEWDVLEQAIFNR